MVFSLSMIRFTLDQELLNFCKFFLIILLTYFFNDVGVKFNIRYLNVKNNYEHKFIKWKSLSFMLVNLYKNRNQLEYNNLLSIKVRTKY